MNARLAAERTIAVFVTTLGLLAMARMSVAPLGAGSAGSARLRLSWSARPERIETCRVLSQKELQKLEEHMRQRVECEGRFATYALRVWMDNRLVHQSVVQGAGLRHDRPIYLLRDLDVPLGTHRLRVGFTRREKTDNDRAAFTQAARSESDSGIFAGRAEREEVEHARRARAAIPPRLQLDTAVTFNSREVVVLTFDSERGGLLLLRGNAGR